MDASLFQMVNGLAGRTPWLDGVMIFSAEFLPIVFFLAFVILYFSMQAHQQRGAFLAGLATLLALAIAILISSLFPRPRPYMTQAAHLLIPRSNDPSFPSDHATLSFAIASMVWWYNRKLGMVFIVLALLVGFSRVYVGTHYPLDVIGGAALGTAVSWFVQRLANRGRIKTLLDGVFETLSDWRIVVRPD
jgi:undecaprenyl-diphosphatase